LLVVRDYDGNPAAEPPAAAIPIVVEERLTMDAAGNLRLEFDADPWGSTISFAPGIPVSLGGTMELAFADGVNLASQVGRTFDLFDWTGVTPAGVFTVSSSYAWNLSNLYATGEVTLRSIGGAQPGDFNNNGAVDGADFLAWQRGASPNPLSASDLTEWQSHLSTSGAEAAAQQSIPEPSALALSAASLLGAAGLRRRRGPTPFSVDGADFLVWQRLLGTAIAGAPTASVPEPSTEATFLCGMLATLAVVPRGRRRRPFDLDFCTATTR
jgi:hypothetical protein